MQKNKVEKINSIKQTVKQCSILALAVSDMSVLTFLKFTEWVEYVS